MSQAALAWLWAEIEARFGPEAATELANGFQQQLIAEANQQNTTPPQQTCTACGKPAERLHKAYNFSAEVVAKLCTACNNQHIARQECFAAGE